ncbi:RNA polymerase sigma factor [Pedobacter nyackensis]|uniref:RNA polymerase sigma-70 factor, ECF subfamily n=1 Tax=Pedobacter nyackensis TaxID=475255 RepID=A0A1W2EU72_9SPHI|nr:RNA polymerase sigma-70 factor [Pedobacter nyackensis]SMD13263.1 RNA polymerase sigma-70 factor, ECF subfamily [Pedobacter nyackensis]
MLVYRTLQDYELLDLMKSDDEAAFKEIYKRYFELLYIHAYKRLQNKEESQDVIQEVFTALWKKREYIMLVSSLRAYLYTAVRNKIFNNISHKHVESSYIQSVQHYIDQGICQTDYLVREHQLLALIEKEIAALPTKMQEIFCLSRNEHLTHKEIAVALNLSEQTVKKQVHNALRILKSKLGVLPFLLLLSTGNF